MPMTPILNMTDYCYDHISVMMSMIMNMTLILVLTVTQRKHNYVLYVKYANW